MFRHSFSDNTIFDYGLRGWGWESELTCRLFKVIGLYSIGGFQLNSDGILPLLIYEIAFQNMETSLKPLQ